MRRKRDSLTADKESVLVVWREEQKSHSIPLSQSLIQGKALLSSMKAERGEEATEGGWKPADVGSQGLREEGVSITEKYR